MWKCLFSQSSYWYGQWDYELQSWSQSLLYNFADNDQQPCHSDYLSNNAFKNAANWDYETNNQGYEMNNWGYRAQQLNYTSLYNFTSNDWQLCCSEYLNDWWNKSQFKHQNKALSSPYLIYFIKTNESYRAYESNDALSVNNNTENEPSHHADVSESSHHTDVFFNDSAQPTQYDDSLYSCYSCEMPLETSENLWNHILDWYKVDTHFSITKAATQQVNYIKHAL